MNPMAPVRRILARILRTDYALGGQVQPFNRPPGELEGIVHPAMHFDSREDMERYVFGREPEDRES